MIHILLSRGILNHTQIYDELKTYLKPHHRVAIIAFSFFPKHVLNEKDYDELYEKGGEYYEKMLLYFIPYGINESHISIVHYFKDDLKTMKKKIDDADIIYFPGGAPDLMMQRLEEKRIVEFIEQQHKKILIGSSAGTMIQFANFYISKDKDYNKFSLNQGLKFINDFNVEVHYRRRKKQKSALRRVHKTSKKPLYAIPDDGAIVYDGKTIQCIHTAHQLYDCKGVIRRK